MQHRTVPQTRWLNDEGIGCLECELQARLAAGKQSFPTACKETHECRARYLNCETKVQLFRSLVLSVLLYGCETWPEQTPSQRRRLEAFQLRCLRRLAGTSRVQIPGCERISDVDLRSGTTSTDEIRCFPHQRGSTLSGCVPECWTESAR